MIEIDELVRLRILENNVDQLHRIVDRGMLSEDMVRMIFGWEKDNSWLMDQISVSPAIVPTASDQPAKEPVIEEELTKQPVLPPPPVVDSVRKKQETEKNKAALMTKVKEMSLEGKSGKYIAQKLNIAQSTVHLYKKELGLLGETSMTEISVPVPGTMG